MPTSLRIFIRAARQWSADGGSRLGAALAYYALFSVAPLLLLAVMIAGAVFGEEAAKGQVEEHLRETIGAESALAVQKLVDSAAKPKSVVVAPALSIGLLVIGALSMFLHVRGALCMIWRLSPPRDSTVLGLLLDYALALAMILFCGIFLLGSLAASMLVNIYQPTLTEWLPGLPWHWLEVGLSFLLLTILFGGMYRILSGARIPWRYVTYGSFIAAVLFTMGKTLLGYYFVYTSTASIYGAAGSLVVFLVWVYYSSQILFFGAELIQARRTRREWLNGEPSREVANPRAEL